MSAGAFYSATALDYGKFGVYATPRSGKTLRDVEAAIDVAIADIRDHGVTADELSLAKNRLIADAVYAQDNQAMLARWYGAALATGETVEMVRRWPEDYSRRECRRGARRSADLARQPRLGHRLSGTRRAGGGETHVNNLTARALFSFRQRLAWLAALPVVAMLVVATPAFATTIERVVSPGGIEAWLVREPAVPMIAIDFAFVGGAAQDPAGKGGTANLVASLLDEGAGEFDSKAFHDRLERKAIELSFQAERDTLRGSLRTLSENKDEAFEDLRLSLNAPRFDAADVEIIRGQVLSLLRRAATSPNEIASQRWWQTAFPGHPYGRPVMGTLDSVPAVTADDLRGYTHRVLARANLKVAVVGDIDAETVKTALDRIFGAIPARPN